MPRIYVGLKSELRGEFVRPAPNAVSLAVDYVLPNEQILLLDDPAKLNQSVFVRVRVHPGMRHRRDGYMRADRLKLLQPVRADGGGVRVGLHGPADAYSWAWDDETFRIFKVARIQSAKILCAGDIGITEIRRLRTEAGVFHIVARLYNVIHPDKPKSAREYIGEIIEPILRLYEAGVSSFELGNEVNLYPAAAPEGMGVSWQNGSEFADWFLEGMAYLKLIIPDAKIGFPAMSPGATIPNYRYNPQRFMIEADRAVQAADWVAMHVYWQDVGGWRGAIDEIKAFADHYAHKIVMVTEFGNLAPVSVVSKAHKGFTYAQFYHAAQEMLPRNVAALHGWVLSGHDFPDHEWRGSDIAERVGARG